MKLIFGTLFVLLSFACISCSNSGSGSVDERGWPTKLRFAYTPDEEQPGRREKVYTLRAEYLAERLGIEVDVVKTTQYGPVIEAMRAKKVEIANFSTFPYLIASKKAGAEIILARGDIEGEVRNQFSQIIVRSDSDLNSFEDLKRNSKEVNFAFVNPASTSGHLIPRYHMEQEGLDPEMDFKELVFPGKHNAAILAVASGKVDAATISSSVLYRYLMMGKVKKDDIKVIWQSPPIPSGGLCVRQDLPDDLKKAIQQAHIDLPEVDPDLDKLIKGITQEYRPEPLGGFMPIDDSYFDPMRALSAKIEGLQMLN